jgi:hypothetical protein
MHMLMFIYIYIYIYIVHSSECVIRIVQELIIAVAAVLCATGFEVCDNCEI